MTREPCRITGGSMIGSPVREREDGLALARRVSFRSIAAEIGHCQVGMPECGNAGLWERVKSVHAILILIRARRKQKSLRELCQGGCVFSACCRQTPHATSPRHVREPPTVDGTMAEMHHAEIRVRRFLVCLRLPVSLANARRHTGDRLCGLSDRKSPSVLPQAANNR